MPPTPSLCIPTEPTRGLCTTSRVTVDAVKPIKPIQNLTLVGRSHYASDVASCSLILLSVPITLLSLFEFPSEADTTISWCLIYADSLSPLPLDLFGVLAEASAILIAPVRSRTPELGVCLGLVLACAAPQNKVCTRS